MEITLHMLDKQRHLQADNMDAADIAKQFIASQVKLLQIPNVLTIIFKLSFKVIGKNVFIKLLRITYFANGDKITINCHNKDRHSVLSCLRNISFCLSNIHKKLLFIKINKISL